MTLNKVMLFDPGRLVCTSGALSHVESQLEFVPLLKRHLKGDWGNVSENDKANNDNSVKSGDQILSSYNLSDGEKIWIITEGDRSATTILLPEEY
jgi:hypothetical protein